MATPSTAVDAREPEPDERRRQRELDDAEAARRDRDHREHVDQPERHEQRVDVGGLAERAQEHPQRGGVEQPVGGRPPGDAAEQLAVAGEVLQPSADVAHALGGTILVEPQLARDPAEDLLGTALPLEQTEHQHRSEAHHDDAGDRAPVA